MRWEKDKWRHFFVGIGMGVVLEGVAKWLLPTHAIIGSTIAFIIVIIISYGFELFSLFTGKGHYEVMDAIAAILGGIIGMSVSYFIF